MDLRKHLSPVYRNNIPGLVRILIAIVLAGIVWDTADLLLPYLFILILASAYIGDLDKYLARFHNNTMAESDEDE